MTQLITFFNELGWAANLIGIGTPIIGLLWWAFSGRKRLFQPATFTALSKKSGFAKMNNEEKKKLCKIAIVDDDPDDFPIAELRKASYSVKSFKQIKLADSDILAAFDVVFLDMHGIIKDDLEQGGLKLITRLRALNPIQKICAVSSKTFDPTATTFFREADDVQKKPISAQKCRDVIDGFLAEKLDSESLASDLDSDKDIEKIRKSLVLLLQKLKSEKSNADNFIKQIKIHGVAKKTELMLLDFSRIYLREN
jgi:hypothetical protein